MFLRYIVTAAIVSFVAAGPCTRQYTVKDGDYCDKISVSQGVSTYQLAVINNGIINGDCSNLVSNQQICLGYQGEDCTSVYTVVKGDTCDAVAAAHKVNTTLLHENNPQIDTECSNIYIGEVLCVASTVIVPPPAGNKPPSVPPTATLANPPPSTPTPQPSTSTPKPSTPTSQPPSYTPQPEEDNDNDDDDLPWCDEL